MGTCKRVFGFLFLACIIMAQNASAKEITYADRDEINTAIDRACRGRSIQGLVLAPQNIRLSDVKNHFPNNPKYTESALKNRNVQSVFILNAKGDFQKNETYDLYQRDLSGRTQRINRYIVMKGGKLIHRDNDNSTDLSQSLIFASGYLPREPVTYMLVSPDAKKYVAATLIPNALEASNEGYKINGILLDSTGLSYAFVGEGFEANEKIALFSKFGNEEISKEYEANEQGKFTASLSPAAKDLNEGDAFFKLTGKRGSVSLSYKIGNSLKL